MGPLKNEMKRLEIFHLAEAPKRNEKTDKIQRKPLKDLQKTGSESSSLKRLVVHAALTSAINILQLESVYFLSYDASFVKKRRGGPSSGTEHTGRGCGKKVEKANLLFRRQGDYSSVKRWLVSAKNSRWRFKDVLI